MPPHATRFVGRSDELTTLGGILERVASGQTSSALIAGDAGVGKTRLIGEVAAAANTQGFRVLIGGCMETGDVGLPYVPLVDAFRSLGPEDRDIVASVASSVPNLGRLLPSMEMVGETVRAGQDGLDQVELFGGIHTLLVRLAEVRPLLLVMEDIHWADTSTRDLLSFLLRTLRSGRVALLATYRADELHRRHPLRPLLAESMRLADVTRIDLSPFDRGELDEHLLSLTGHRVDPATLDLILARSEGNPFYTEELVAAGATTADASLPHGLAEVLRDRIETLSEDAQELLKVAAVAGRRVGHDLLVGASGRAEVEIEKDLREVLAAQVLVVDASGATYRFRHALLQEAVYNDLLPGERTRLHSSYARLLADSGPAAELAHHHLASHDLPGALGALVTAAVEATAVAAPAEALTHLTQAIEIWDQVPDAEEVSGLDRGRLLLRAAAAAGNAGEFKKAIAFARSAVDASDETTDPLQAALAHERLGEHLYQGDSPEEQTFAALRKAVELVPADPPTQQRARVTATLARALVGWSYIDEARGWCDEALRVARAVESAEDETHALITLASLELRSDSADKARALFIEARDKAASIGARFQELRAQFSLGALALDEGQLEQGAVELERALEKAREYGLFWGQYGINSNVLRIFTSYALGRWDQTDEIALTIDERYVGAANFSAALLYVGVARGDEDVPERIAALERAAKEIDWVGYMRAGTGADHAVWQGDPETAQRFVDEILIELEAGNEGWELSSIWPAALGVMAQADRAEQARAASDTEALEAARTAGLALLQRCRDAVSIATKIGRQIGPEARAWLARAEAEFTRLEGQPDVELWRASVEAFSYGYVYEEARSRWRLGEALLTAGDRDGASEDLCAAHRVAEGLGAEPLRTRIEALARRGRIDLGTDQASPDGLAGLTARELEVLKLVADGRSNQQIADALFISRKTASVHVSHILSKLGVATRVEAAAAAHRAGFTTVDG